MKKQDFLNISIFKYLILLLSVVLICIACNQNKNPRSSNEIVDPFEGVWELTHNYVLANGDTVYIGDTGGTQHKVYLDGYFMWTTDPASDSTEWHGFGTYQLRNDTIIEKLLSMSIPMKAAMGSEEEAILTIEYDENTFRQVIESMVNDTVYQQIEVYKKLN